MKAIIWTKYGSPDGLKLKEINKPVPGDMEILVKVHATTVTAGDYEMRSLKFPFWLRLPMRLYVGLLRPARVSIIGQELAGEVESVGRGVTQYKPGDRVFGATGFRTGTYAEYVCLPEVPDDAEGVLALMPANVSYEEAAAVPTGGLEALHFLRKAAIQPGHKILINGAGGSIGTFGVQLAKLFGAEVTAVDSAGKLDMLRSIGADHVLDYTKEDFTQNGQIYDVIFDVIGKSPFLRAIRALNPGGAFLMANPKFSRMILGGLVSKLTGKRVIFEMNKQEKEDLVYLRNLVEEGKLKTVIGKRYPLEQMAEAHRYVETGAKQGNLVITLNHT
ncbi:MAG: NAD(P)-dependent alcohol dehydrogenase [Anaerolineales bacterium]|nr:NAD(P)-dependent alcohol dehydrogenase [Anaerolineales bacterium]